MAKDNNPAPGWYFNTRTNQVEHGEISKAIDRLGPYPDRAGAERALETARTRTETEDKADRNWDSQD